MQMHTCVSIQRRQQISYAVAFQWRCKSDAVCVCSLSLWPCIRCLIFCAFDTLVRSGFFFPRCYVMINLPLGTWRPLAPQRIWRTLCAIPACFSFSPTYKTGICILIPLWPLSEIVSQLLPLWFLVIVWKRNHNESRRSDANWLLLFQGKFQSFSLFLPLFPNCMRSGSIW